MTATNVDRERGKLAGVPRAPASTPYLLIDEAVCDHNIRTAAAYFQRGPTKLRPHFKAHKCLNLLHKQLAAGGCCGVTCATAWEAKALAASGIDKILIANQVVDPLELVAVGEAAKLADIEVAVDSAFHVSLLERMAVATGVRLGVLIEIDVGLGRCGLPPSGDGLDEVSNALAVSDHLEFRGIQGYEGHAALEPDPETRLRLVQEAAGVLKSARKRLGQLGLSVSVISGGSTGTYDAAATAPCWTEIQAGSYVLMDATYAKLGLPFRNALYCVGTVISRHGNRGVINIGLKSISAEYGLPESVDPNIRVLGLSDEHTRVAVEGNSVMVGDLVQLIPGHIDPTINLHERVFVWSGQGAFDEWPILTKARLAF